MRGTLKISLMIATSILATGLLSAAVESEGDGFRLEGRDYRARVSAPANIDPKFKNTPNLHKLNHQADNAERSVGCKPGFYFIEP